MAEALSSLVAVFLDKLATLIQKDVSMPSGVRSELEVLDGKVTLIKCLLADAENKACHSETIRVWLKQLKDVIYDADDLVEDFKAAGEDNASSSSSSGQQQEPSSSAGLVRTALSSSLSLLHKFVFNHKVGQRLKDINSRLEWISKERSQLQLIPDLENKQRPRLIGHQASSLVEPDITGEVIQLDAKKLVGVLVGDGSCGLDLVAITGMGGIGKTTLAQILYNDQLITANFQISIWVCVSKEFSTNKLLRQIIEGAGVYAGEAHTRGHLELMLKSLTQGKKTFLVLDDIWTADVWEDLLRNPLQGVAAGSKVLITTRFESVAKRVGSVHLHPVTRMTSADGWFLLCKKVFIHGEAFEEMESLKDVGLRIVERCCYLPLAIKVVGGVLRGKGKNREEWEEVLQWRTWSSSIFPEDMKDDKVMEALHLSYEDLPPHLKQCFLYLSLFPEDHVFMRQSVVRKWVAEGFVKTECDALTLEQTGDEYFKELVSRSLLQPEFAAVEGAQCRMHDLLRSLAQFLAEDENFFGDTSKLRGVSPKLRRLSIAESDGDASIDQEALKSKECLRTLFLFKKPLGGLVLRTDIVETLRNLRVLDLREAHIDELPHSITKLRHLRYLDVSGTVIRELPESVAGLRSLQFLLLKNCSNIRALPIGITKLQNLRTLETDDGTEIDQMPKGIGGMTQLRNLNNFVVDRVGRTLGELGPLVNLRHLTISKLERVSDKEGAKSAALENKTLIYLGLQSTLPAVSSCDEEVKSRMVDVFDGLRPPPSLQYLDIIGYMGNALPAWMWPSAASTSVPPIHNLECVILNRCMNFSQLPPLGLLPHLKTLWISGAYAVTTAISSNYQDVTAAGTDATVLFPELEILSFIDMPNLQDIWGWEGDGKGESLKAFPLLRYLNFQDCPKLRRLPNCFSSRLKFLHIIECPDLMEVGNLIVAESLTVRDSKTDEVPPWLGQVSVDPCVGDGVPFLLLKLRFCLLERMLRQKKENPENSEGDWYTIQRFPRSYVTATDEESAFLCYNKDSSFFNTNVQITPCSSGGQERENKRQRVE
ncbi:hypothetical protein Taro_025217 [Colocasia esculenta]|uniref:Uncharacterized protein n=1 Tax=Colocasia esculenta TaxID=4460 RepID=A0A843V8V8_COLES|nr:hypothetical protein [Colocasia esculenta]